jgi:hypothetical protein
MSRPFVLGKTALRDMPEQDYDSRALVRELESAIRSAWRSMQDYRRKARENAAVGWRAQMDREGAVTMWYALRTLLEVRRAGRLR